MNVDYALLAAPFVAGLLVLLTHIPLGTEVLGRGIIFIDLAIAQVASLGVVVVQTLGWESPWMTQVGAGCAALIGALCLSWTQRRWPAMQEALIGLLFVFAAALGVLVLANNPHGGEHLQEMLAGQILFVHWSQLIPVAGLYAVVLALRWALKGRWGHLGFYALFALTVMASVQLVGVLLVFASLMAPAVAVSAFKRYKMVYAYGLGALGYALGLWLSAVWDWPAGAAIVCSLVGLCFCALMIFARPEHAQADASCSGAT